MAGDAALLQPVYILEGSAADLQADGANRNPLGTVVLACGACKHLD
jgi:hypothetical protein